MITPAPMKYMSRTVLNRLLSFAMEPDSAALRAQRAQFVKIVGLALGLLLVYTFIPLQDQWWWIGMLVGIAALLVPLSALSQPADSTSEGGKLAQLRGLQRRTARSATAVAAETAGVRTASPTSAR